MIASLISGRAQGEARRQVLGPCDSESIPCHGDCARKSATSRRCPCSAHPRKTKRLKATYTGQHRTHSFASIRSVNQYLHTDGTLALKVVSEDLVDAGRVLCTSHLDAEAQDLIAPCSRGIIARPPII